MARDGAPVENNEYENYRQIEMKGICNMEAKCVVLSNEGIKIYDQLRCVRIKVERSECTEGESGAGISPRSPSAVRRPFGLCSSAERVAQNGIHGSNRWQTTRVSPSLSKTITHNIFLRSFEFVGSRHRFSAGAIMRLFRWLFVFVRDKEQEERSSPELPEQPGRIEQRINRS